MKSKNKGQKSKKANEGKIKVFNGREEKGWVYHLSQARWHLISLKEASMVKLAKTIEERGWTQSKAAEFLGVSQLRISDLMRSEMILHSDNMNLPSATLLDV